MTAAGPLPAWNVQVFDPGFAEAGDRAGWGPTRDVYPPDETAAAVAEWVRLAAVHGADRVRIVGATTHSGYTGRHRPAPTPTGGSMATESLLETYRGACVPVASRLYDRIDADPALAPVFGPVNTRVLRKKMALMLLITLWIADRPRHPDRAQAEDVARAAEALSLSPGGADMADRLRQWHAGVPITAAAFGRVAGHLDAALAGAGMIPDDRATVMATVGGLAPIVVNTDDPPAPAPARPASVEVMP